VAALLAPLFLVLGTEAALRLAGWGYPTGFFLKKKENGKVVVSENPRFGWRFFPPEAARTPQPLKFTAEKPAGTVRVFVFGESAAMGDPEPSYGFARQLERLLQARHPDQKIEVINVAMTAINSHAIREIAKDCAPLGVDFWLVFAGNNEVIGPFGAGTVFGRQAPALFAVRLTLTLERTRVGQVLSLFGKSSKEPKTWEGMELFLGQRVPRGDARLKNVYRNFRVNICDIANQGCRCGDNVLLYTIPENL